MIQTLKSVKKGLLSWLRRPDAAAVALILALTMLASLSLLIGGTAVGMDTATQFYPWYSYLGESLRSGEIPGWNPSQFSGAPFAGDPLSGWTYLPAMLLFTLLPINLAAKAYLLFHLLLAGLATYALARKLRMGTLGALLAAVAYGFTTFLYVQNVCCTAYAGVVAWLPLVLLGAEGAIQSSRWLDRGLWWGLSGLGLSQILASWLGQGSYYALIATGGYVAYRTLLFPPEHLLGVRGRLSGLFVNGGAILLFGFGLAAAGILPRLEYNALSGLAGGYPGSEPDLIGGWTVRDWARLFRSPGLFYAGVVTLALALAAPFIVGRRFAAPYFAGLAVLALTLSGQGLTLFHSALYLLPGFERLHPHNPERVMVVFYLAAALLAGAALAGLRGREKPILAAIPALAALFLVTRSTRPAEAAGPWEAPLPVLVEYGVSIPTGSFVALILAAALAAYALIPSRRILLRNAAALALILVVFADLLGAALTTVSNYEAAEGGEAVRKLDLAEYYAPTDATRFLQSAGEEPSRYLGYYPRATKDGKSIPYSIRFDEPETRALEVNNRATLFEGLQSVQGYNPTHLARYDEFLRALNDRRQNYHDADVFAEGFDSPLLDLLNVRHIVIPAEVAPGDSEDIRELERKYPTVYEDERVKILENGEALPRAWIVHSAREAQPEETLDLLSSGEVDPRKTALLAEEPPELAWPEDPAGDRAAVVSYEADRIRVEAETSAPGLLVLSEVYYPAWRAYVDGEPAEIYRVGQLLRAVPVPAGEHTVELRYESLTLQIGTAISLATASVLLVLILARMRSNKNHPKVSR